MHMLADGIDEAARGLPISYIYAILNDLDLTAIIDIYGVSLIGGENSAAAQTEKARICGRSISKKNVKRVK